MNTIDTVLNDLKVNIIYSARKTISLELKSEGIFVRAPKGMSQRQIKLFLNEKRNWIEKHWKKYRREQKK